MSFKCKNQGDNESGGNLKESLKKGLKGFENVMRRYDLYTCRICIQGKREIGRPKRRWLDRVRCDTREKGLSGKEVNIILSSYIDQIT